MADRRLDLYSSPVLWLIESIVDELHHCTATVEQVAVYWATAAAQCGAWFV